MCARVLWRRGRPECGDLADALADAGVEGFGADAVRITTAHAETCELCARERRALRLDPTRIFAPSPWWPRRSCSSSAPRTRSWPRVCRSVGRTTAAEDPRPRRPRRGRRVGLAVAASIVLLVVVLAAIVVLADRLDHGTVDGRPVSAHGHATTVATTDDDDDDHDHDGGADHHGRTAGARGAGARNSAPRRGPDRAAGRRRRRAAAAGAPRAGAGHRGRKPSRPRPGRRPMCAPTRPC